MFWFRLAGHLGMSVARCQQEVSSAEFAMWMAYYQVEPFGEERADWRAAIMPVMFANAFKGQGGRTYQISDFMYSGKKPRRRQTAAQMEAVLRGIGAAQVAATSCRRDIP